MVGSFKEMLPRIKNYFRIPGIRDSQDMQSMLIKYHVVFWSHNNDSFIWREYFRENKIKYDHDIQVFLKNKADPKSSLFLLLDKVQSHKVFKVTKVHLPQPCVVMSAYNILTINTAHNVTAEKSMQLHNLTVCPIFHLHCNGTKMQLHENQPFRSIHRTLVSYRQRHFICTGNM